MVLFCERDTSILEEKELRVPTLRVEPATFQIISTCISDALPLSFRETHDRLDRLTEFMMTNFRHTASLEMLNVTLLHNDDDARRQI